MRGKLGDTLSVYGDSMYDWAKLLQSLIGYDHILQNKTINMDYQEKMVHLFFEQFGKMYSNDYISYLKIITKSLLFTLIPLHDTCNNNMSNNNIFKFYDLIFSKFLE